MSLFGNVSAINSSGKCIVMNLSSTQITSRDCFSIASGKTDVLSFGCSDIMGHRLQFPGVHSFITRTKKNVSPLKVWLVYQLRSIWLMQVTSQTLLMLRLRFQSIPGAFKAKLLVQKFGIDPNNAFAFTEQVSTLQEEIQELRRRDETREQEMRLQDEAREQEMRLRDEAREQEMERRDAAREEARRIEKEAFERDMVRQSLPPLPRRPRK